MKQVVRIFSLTLALSTANCYGPTSPTELPDFIEKEFSIAIEKLLCVKSQENLDKFTPQYFHYISHPDESFSEGCGVFSIPDYGYVHGHFSIPRSIHYAKNCKRVISHELGHGILYAFGDRYYFCWEHYKKYEEGVERFQECPMHYLKPCQ